MAEALKTVADYIQESRVLLQDTVSSVYRYSDADIVRALNIGFQEAYRLRPDLFLGPYSFTISNFTESTPTAVVPMDIGYRQAFIYYIVGRTQLRDQEDTTDQRAGALLQKFAAQLISAG